jgi:hypothetical protein
MNVLGPSFCDSRKTGRRFRNYSVIRSGQRGSAAFVSFRPVGRLSTPSLAKQFPSIFATA